MVMWPFRKSPNVIHVVPTMTVAKADFDRIVADRDAAKTLAAELEEINTAAIAERDAANTQLERVSEKNSQLLQMCERLDHTVGALDQESKRYQARIRELEAAIGPDAKALMDIASIITKRENERINTAPAETKQTEPLPTNDRNMSVFDTANWEVTAPEKQREAGI